jgi:hypothetical protein
MTAAHTLSQATRRPYWLLLVLALFLAGQVASAQHWHDTLSDAADYDCALCVLSGTSTGAITTSAWQAPALIVFAFVFFYCHVATQRAVVRFSDARAPPFYS